MLRPRLNEKRIVQRKRRMLKALTLLTFGLTLVISGCGGTATTKQDSPPSPAAPADVMVIKHIIYMLQENRSFDQYFGQLNAYRQSQGLSSDVDVTPSNASQLSYDHSTTFTPFHMNSQCMEDLSSFWNESHNDWNHLAPTSATPLMDGFANSAGGEFVLVQARRHGANEIVEPSYDVGIVADRNLDADVRSGKARFLERAVENELHVHMHAEAL